MKLVNLILCDLQLCLISDDLLCTVKSSSSECLFDDRSVFPFSWEDEAITLRHQTKHSTEPTQDELAVLE